jgi:hypothetical protein
LLDFIEEYMIIISFITSLLPTKSNQSTETTRIMDDSIHTSLNVSSFVSNPAMIKFPLESILFSENLLSSNATKDLGSI